MAQVPYEMWVDYLELLWLMQDVKPQSVLDVCCGTGTCTELLAAKGHDMTGIDISPFMIEAAVQKAAAKKLHIHYAAVDAAEMNLVRTFDAAFSFFDSLNYITDPEQLQRAMHRVSEHLLPGGSWIFDLNTAYAFEQDLFTQRDKRKSSKLHYDWKGHYDRGSRLIRVDMKFWLDGREFDEVHHQRAYSDDEIRSMLDEAGFCQVVCYESYSLDKPRAVSDRVHYACVRVE